MDHPVFNLENAAMERWRKGDPMGFVEISAENICYVEPGLARPIVGLDDYRKYMQGLEGQVHYQRSEFLNPKIVDVKDASVLTYNYRSSVLTPEGAVESQTLWNCTEVYFKQHIVHNHWSYIRHRVPEVVEVPVTVRPGPLRYEGVLGELMSLEAGAMERWRKGDPWGFIEISAPDVTYFDTGTPHRIDGLLALEAEYQPRQGKIFYDVMDFIDPCVQVYGDLAVLFYRFFSTRVNPDGSVAFRVPWNCSEVFQRLPDGWKIIHTHWSHIRGERY